MDCSQQYIKAFNDVRRSSPELNRPDLYSLTGEDREWAARIIRVSHYSQNYAGNGENQETSRAPHMNIELALLLKEDKEWANRVSELIISRRLNASEVSPEFVRNIHTEGAPTVNEGML